MTQIGDFKCLRCGHEYKKDYKPKVVEEKTCPQCGSNSVRRLKAPSKERDTS